jgi:hypothetical protein
MLPFDLYRGGGRKLLGVAPGSNARHEYCPKLIELNGDQKRCAYCDADLTATYEVWLTMVLDHVIPTTLCKSNNICSEWTWDYSNTVLACAACNGFCNRYKLDINPPPDTIDAFYDLRDKIFAERKKKIAERHIDERRFFNELRAKWNGAPAASPCCDTIAKQ